MGRLKHIILLISIAVCLSNSAPVAFNEKNLSENDDSQKDVAEIIESVNEKVDKILFEGDIVLDEKNRDVDGPQEGNEKRNARRDRLRIWKTKVVPYVIDQSLRIPTDDGPRIQEAIEEFHKHTCVKFVSRTSEKNWINFVKKSGCYSSVGKIYWRSGGQDVSIGQGCAHKGTIMHELLHALGFWHEQSRPDRDRYVKIMWENIKPGKEHNFNKYDHGKIDKLKATYDFGSIMHYGKYSFSSNRKPTIEAINNPNQKLGQRNRFSKTDIFEVNALYDCSGPSNGWSSWSDYGPCDNNCKKIRQRFCSSSDVSNCPGANAYGVEAKNIQCSHSECYAPVDGHWGRWSSWNQCSVTCGQGIHTRTRQCSDPLPKNGGKPCSGDSKETKVCKQKRCGLGPDDCEFEIDMCSWTTDPKNTYQWHRKQGSTSSQATGPNGDATKPLNGTGFYVYAESSSPVRQNQKTELRSPVLTATSGRCLQFAYNMYGSTIGSLNVYVLDVKTGTKKRIFTISSDQGQRWHRTNATITTSNDYKVVFEVIRGSSYTGDIALDDIFFKDGKCAGKGATSTTSRPWTAGPTTSRLSTVGPTTIHPSTAAPTTSRPSTSRPVTSSPTPQGPVDCDFEIDMCSWTTNPKNIYQWHRKQGSTPSYATGPKGDATKPLNGTGFYVYAESSSPVQKNQKTELRSPVLTASSGLCLQFAYNMYGSTIGSLNVYVLDVKTGTKKGIFTISSDQGQHWHRASATITTSNDYKVVFEVIRGSSYTGDIALDDIFFKDGKCAGKGPTSTTSRPWTAGPTTSRLSTVGPTTIRPSTAAPTTSRPSTSRPVTSSPTPQGPVDCDFEIDMCSWTTNPKNTYQWHRKQGSTPSYATGPKGDATKPLNGTGFYVYAESSSPVQKNQKTELRSPVLTASSGLCLQFAYNMYGSTIGSLNVYVLDVKTRTKKEIFTISSDQGQHWHRASATITTSNDYKVVFEVIRGSSYTGDIALDDIFFKDGKCAGKGPTSTTSRPWTAGPTTSRLSTVGPTTIRPSTAAPTTSRPSTSRPVTSSPTPQGPVDCDFEIDMCSWTTNPKNTYQWHRKQGSTPSYATGPKGDATKPLNGTGFYVYAESSSPVQKNQKTELRSPVLTSTSGLCLQFAYNMYGSTIGSLNVYVLDVKTGTKKKIFTISSDQGQHWHRASATITTSNDYKVMFEVIRGSSYTGDIALDDISFKDGKCAGKGPTSTTSRPWTAGPTTSRLSTVGPTTIRPSTAAPTTSRPSTSRPVTSSPTPQVFVDGCNFDQDMCGWKTGPGTNTFSWTRRSGSTPSYKTGPNGDHTSGSGSYVYVETSSPAKKGQTATLVSKVFPPAPSGRCMSFFYHMYGATMGSLHVYIKSASTPVQSRVFKIIGDQKNKWHQAVINISNMICHYEIVFESVRGTSYHSDIALDDITFSKGPCPKRV